MLNFSFDYETFIAKDDDTFEYIPAGKNSLLQIKSFIQKNGWFGNEIFLNPIVQTGVDISVHIIAEKKYFNIGIDKRQSSIYYKYNLPPWSINYAMVFKFLFKIFLNIF
jgi:hypothetical protein